MEASNADPYNAGRDQRSIYPKLLDRDRSHIPLVRLQNGSTNIQQHKFYARRRKHTHLYVVIKALTRTGNRYNILQRLNPSLFPARHKRFLGL